MIKKTTGPVLPDAMEVVEPTVVKTPQAEARMARIKNTQPLPDAMETPAPVETPVVETPPVEQVKGPVLPEPMEVVPEPLKTTPTVAEDGTVAPTETETPTPATTETPAPTKTETAQLKSNEFIAQNEDEAFQVLQKGGKLANTAENAKFKARYNAYQRINALDAASLADMSVKGTLDQKMMDRLAQLNPQKWAEVNKLADNGAKISSINQSGERLFNSATGVKQKEQPKQSEGILSKYMESYESGNSVIKNLYNKLTDGELSDLAVDIAEKEAKNQELQDEIDRVYEDLRGQFPTLPKSIVLGMAATATRDLNRQLTTGIRQYNTTIATYNAKKDDIEAEIKFAQDNQSNSMDFLSKIYDTTKSDEIRVEDLARADEEIQRQIDATDKSEVTRKAELEQARMDTAMVAVANLGGDPTKFTTVEGMWKEAGRLQADALKKAGISAPMNVGGGKVLIQNPDGSWKWMSSSGDISPGYTSADGTFTPPTGFKSRGANQSVPVTQTADGGIEIGIPSGTVLDNTNNGAECGGLANDYASGIPGYKRVDNDYASKLANRNSMEPVAGGMAMWTPGKFEDNGHIGIVEKVFSDGSFQIYDTNYVAKNTTSRRIIKPGDKEYDLIQKTGGFFNPGKQELPSEIKDIFSAIDGEPTSDQRKMIESMGYNIGDYYKFNEDQKKEGVYDEPTSDFINKFNTSLPTTNKTYSRYTASKDYIGKAIAALDRASGTGDIAAINQFQKVIDEGAVTRDQDVKLIQDADSFLNKMKLSMKKLEKGDQLSPDVRQEMKNLMNDILQSGAKAVLEDPGIKASYKTLQTKGIRPQDTILSEIESSLSATTKPKTIQDQIYEDLASGMTADEIIAEIKKDMPNTDFSKYNFKLQ